MYSARVYASEDSDFPVPQKRNATLAACTCLENSAKSIDEILSSVVEGDKDSSATTALTSACAAFRSRSRCKFGSFNCAKTWSTDAWLTATVSCAFSQIFCTVIAVESKRWNATSPVSSETVS